MKSFSYNRELPAPAGRVVELIATEQYYHDRYQGEALIDVQVEIVRDDAESFECRVQRTVAAGSQMPRVARRLVGDRITIAQHSRWSRQGPTYPGYLNVTVPGMPGEITSDLEIRSLDDERCELRAQGAIKVNIPLVGGQIERFLSSMAEETFAESMETIHDYVTQAQSSANG